MKLIHDQLVVGEKLGRVPEEAPQVPLQRDLQKEQKRLRFPAEALDKRLELDLRKPNDLDRSRLLHRLRLLGVHWGKPERTSGKGTFKEGWTLRWEPELEVDLISAAPFGNTVETAAGNAAVSKATNMSRLPDLTSLIEILLLADLPEAVSVVMNRLENVASLTSDVSHLMDALPPLVNVLRYGNVRQTDASMVGHVVNGLVARLCVGLPPACSAMNEEAAEEMTQRINSTENALATLDDAQLTDQWVQTLQRLAADETLNSLISGRCCRILFDRHVMGTDDAGTRLMRCLSRGNPPSHAAFWFEGFLHGSGLVLIHQADLWNLISNWVASLSADHFVDVLPLLRRTFSEFSTAERRQMGELSKRGCGGTDASVQTLSAGFDDVDADRANTVVPVLEALLGRNQEPSKV